MQSGQLLLREFQITRNVKDTKDAPQSISSPVPRTLFQTVLAIIATESVLIFVFASRAWWYADDFINFEMAREMGLTWKYISRNLFGHFAPLYQLSYYALLRMAPYNHEVVAVVETLLFMVSLLLLYKLLGLVSERSWLHVALTGLFGSSIIHLQPISWWASALFILTMVPLGLSCLILFLKYEAEDRPLYLAGSVGAFVAALSFYEPSMLFAGVLILLTAFYLPRGPGVSEMVRAVATRWRVWILYIAPAVASVAYRIFRSDLYQLPPPPSAADLLGFIRIAWTDGFVPSVFGLNCPDRKLFGSASLTVTLTQATFGAVVVASILRRKSAWRAWLLFAIPFLGSILAAGWARAGPFGPGMGIYPQYLSFGPLLLVLCFAFAFGREKEDPQGALVFPGGRKTPQLPFVTKPVWRLIFTAGALCYTSQVLVSGYSMMTGHDVSSSVRRITSGPFATRRFFQTFEADLTAMRAQGLDPKLIDSPATPLIPEVFYPYSLYSRTLARLDKTVRFTQDRKQGYVVSEEGHLLRVEESVLEDVKPEKP